MTGQWVLLCMLMLTMLSGLVLQGYTRHEIGQAGSSTADGQTATVPGDGPILYDQGGELVSRSLPPRTVALTFDDGPDPRWTPEILDILDRENVPATFFVVGSRVAASPEVLRRALRQGAQIGIHTFTHTDLSKVSPWRSDLELSLTELALAGVSGVQSALLRPPYSSTPNALTAAEVTAARDATGDGYLLVLADRDSEDWRRPGVAAIVSNALPAGDAGAVIMFHDAGGDRSQTVAALPVVISQLKARGYRFTTVTGALGMRSTAGVERSRDVDRLTGIAFLETLRLSGWIAGALQWLLVPLGALALLRTLVLVVLAHRHVRAYAGRARSEEFLPPVSVVVPAYNEEVGIAAAVHSLASSDHPNLEVIVVDDGSTDRTAEKVQGLGLPNVRLVRQSNRGKASALNTGVEHARHDVIVMVDGDTVFERGTVRHLVQQLQDPAVGAVSGNTKVGNRRGLLGRWQHLEYVSGFNLDRRMYDVLQCMPTVPGAIGAFRRSVLEKVGGVSTDTLAEDTDLTMAVNRAGFAVVYEERARAWTEAPSTLGALWRQRYRWCYGTLQAVWKHRAAVFSTGPGRQLGRIGLPYLLCFQVLLPLLAPVIDLYALYGLLFLEPIRVTVYWLSFLLLQVVTAAYALRLDGERLKPLWALALQQFVYRQVMYLVVVQSLASAVTGVRLRWQKLERTGDMSVLGHQDRRE